MCNQELREGKSRMGKVGRKELKLGKWRGEKAATDQQLCSRVYVGDCKEPMVLEIGSPGFSLTSVLTSCVNPPSLSFIICKMQIKLTPQIWGY